MVANGFVGMRFNIINTNVIAIDSYRRHLVDLNLHQISISLQINWLISLFKCKWARRDTLIQLDLEINVKHQEPMSWGPIYCLYTEFTNELFFTVFFSPEGITRAQSGCLQGMRNGEMLKGITI